MVHSVNDVQLVSMAKDTDGAIVRSDGVRNMYNTTLYPNIFITQQRIQTYSCVWFFLFCFCVSVSVSVSVLFNQQRIQDLLGNAFVTCEKFCAKCKQKPKPQKISKLQKTLGAGGTQND